MADRKTRTRTWTGLWRGKWVAEGARTLGEIADRLEAEAKHLRKLADDGVTLAGEVEDDYAWFSTTSAKVAKKLKMQRA